MAGKTTKDVREDAADVGAVDPEDAPDAEAGTSANAGRSGAVGERPAPRRRRRVRVIEVLDDEDLDEVLDAIDAEDAATEEADETETAARPKPKPKPKSRPKAASTTESEPRPASRHEDDDEDDEDDEEDEPSATAKAPRRRTPVSLDEAAPSTILGLRPVQAVVVVLVVAVLASLAIWQWRTAAGLAADRDARREVSKVASAYGDIALNYNAANYQTQMKKAEALMGGDLLESFRTTTLPNLGTTFKQNPQLELTSKTDQVFVGGVDERFATVTISVDVTVKTAEGVHQAPATLIRLAMAKIDGRWKVTKMYASGVNDQTRESGGLPSVPTSPAPGSSPKNDRSGDDKKPKD